MNSHILQRNSLPLQLPPLRGVKGGVWFRKNVTIHRVALFFNTHDNTVIFCFASSMPPQTPNQQWKSYSICFFLWVNHAKQNVHKQHTIMCQATKMPSSCWFFFVSCSHFFGTPKSALSKKFLWVWFYNFMLVAFCRYPFSCLFKLALFSGVFFLHKDLQIVRRASHNSTRKVRAWNDAF